MDADQAVEAVELPTKLVAKKRPVRTFTIILLAIFFIALLLKFNLTMVSVRGDSMKPTLVNGRRVLVSKPWLVGGLRKGDIIVLKETAGNDYFIKRIYGLPGDTIEYAYAPYNWDPKKGPFIVPEGRVHVIGDNINGSDDSRKFGPFELEKVIGKVLVWR